MSHFSLPRNAHRTQTCPHCGRRLHRHGGKRWFCPRCERTFSFRHRRRGPKRRLRSLLPTTIRRFLENRHTVRSLQARSGRSYGATHRRLHRGLRRLIATVPPLELPQRLPLVLVADALWLWIGEQRVTVYVVLLRPLRKTEATVAVVLARAEWECEAGWRAALLQLPESVRRFVRAACVDDHAGLSRALRGLCGKDLPIQWCQFHCLAELLRKLGKKAVKRNPVTREVWTRTRALLGARRREVRRRLGRHLHRLAASGPCPLRTRRALRWFRARVPTVTVCFEDPRLRMPSTTGSAEAVCKQLRRLLAKVRPRSLDQATNLCALFVRLHPTVHCNGKTPQK